MTASIEQVASSACPRLIRSLVRIHFRNGIPLGAFADVADKVYAGVPPEGFGITGRNQSKSRVSRSLPASSGTDP
jgi:hypothetical protein